MKGLNTWVITRMKVLGALVSPKDMTSHSYIELYMSRVSLVTRTTRLGSKLSSNRVKLFFGAQNVFESSSSLPMLDSNSARLGVVCVCVCVCPLKKKT